MNAAQLTKQFPYQPFSVILTAATNGSGVELNSKLQEVHEYMYVIYGHGDEVLPSFQVMVTAATIASGVELNNKLQEVHEYIYVIFGHGNEDLCSVLL